METPVATVKQLLKYRFSELGRPTQTQAALAGWLALAL